MAYVYVLKSLKSSKTYVGSTNDLERRISEHNSGKSTFTNKYRPWILFYYEETETLEEARKREKYFKTCSGRKFIKNLFPHIPG
ncbi:MAG: GIY-YIG nuclease family protein [Patescibacteria group bacterium]|jgi:putative endonuclease